MIYANQIQDMELLSDQLQPQEASKVLGGMIEREINFYKLQMLKAWVRNHKADHSEYNQKINALHQLKEQLSDVVAKAEAGNYKLQVGTRLDLQLVK